MFKLRKRRDKKMMKRLVSLILSICVVFSAVSAFAAFEKSADAQVKISGTTNAQALVGVQVFVKGYDADDLETLAEGKKFTDILVYHNQKKADSDGNYEFVVDDLPSGEYTAYVGYDDGTEEEAQDLLFRNYEEFKAIVERGDGINDEDAGDLKTIIDNQPYAIGLTNDTLKYVDTEGLAKVLEKTLDDDTKILANKPEEAFEIVNEALLVQKLNQKLITNIYNEDNKYSELSENEAIVWYTTNNKDYKTTALELDFTNRLSGKSFKSYDEYEKAITESFILATVKNPNGQENVEKIMTEFADDIDITVGKGTPSGVWGYLAEKDYSTFENLKKAFNGYGNDDGGNGGNANVKDEGDRNNKPSVPNTTVGSNLLISAPTGVSTVFSDINNVGWAKKAIEYLANKGIINGIGEDKFNPNGNVTREQFAKIAVNAFAPSAVLGDANFADVDNNAWYASYVKKAVAAGIAKGMDSNNFGIGKNITRQDMCVMIYNAAKSAGYTFNTAEGNKFSDNSKIANYAKEAVYALRNAGAVNGLTEDSFAPLGNATRAQAAKIIHYIITEM